ncbi:AtpZ/AtpI family protein [bacterium]|nr:AtpZ/AtpI family protein [bacterium]
MDKSRRPGTGKPLAGLSAMYMITQFSWQVAASLLIGLAIDRFLDTSPWGILILSMLGLIGAVVGLIRAGLQALEKNRR